MALQSMTALASITLQESTASVSFSGIPQNYRDLVLSANIIGFSSSESYVRYLFNEDLNEANYSRVFARGDGSTTSSGINNNPYVGPYNSSPSNFTFNIFDYSLNNKHKTLLIRTSSAPIAAQMTASRWASTSVINSFKIEAYVSNFAPGTTFNLYGRIG